MSKTDQELDKILNSKPEKGIYKCSPIREGSSTDASSTLGYLMCTDDKKATHEQGKYSSESAIEEKILQDRANRYEKNIKILSGLAQDLRRLQDELNRVKATQAVNGLLYYSTQSKSAQNRSLKDLTEEIVLVKRQMSVVDSKLHASMQAAADLRKKQTAKLITRMYTSTRQVNPVNPAIILESEREPSSKNHCKAAPGA